MSLFRYQSALIFFVNNARLRVYVRDGFITASVFFPFFVASFFFCDKVHLLPGARHAYKPRRRTSRRPQQQQRPVRINSLSPSRPHAFPVNGTQPPAATVRISEHIAGQSIGYPTKKKACVPGENPTSKISLTEETALPLYASALTHKPTIARMHKHRK